MFSVLPVQAFEADQAGMLVDGDTAFLRVNNRLPAHALPPGEVASATNKRFENGKAKPRFGIALEPWGSRHLDLVPLGLTYASNPTVAVIIGQRYHYVPDPNGGDLSYSGFPVFDVKGNMVAAVETDFIAVSTPINLNGESSASVRVQILVVCRTLAYAEFNNPADADIGILITDALRSDGGRGRCYRIQSNNVPLEVSMNGHDAWDTSRLCQAANAMVMARHGNERHYFNAAAVNTATEQIQLNTLPAWADGDLVEYNADLSVGSYILGPAQPANGAQYFVKIIAGNKVELYTQFTAPTFSGQLTFDSASGRFWLRRVATRPGYFGNDAPPLILQPDAEGRTAFEAGWLAVPVNVPVTGLADLAGGDQLTAPNHRLNPGDQIVLTGVTITSAPASTFARPVSEHAFTVHTSAANALLGTSPLTDITAISGSATLKKSSASSLPMPPLREMIYWKGCLWGISGRDKVVKSDPFDFLHFVLYTGTIPANFSEAGNANWLRPLGEDALVIGKDFSIGVLSVPDPAAPATWALNEITREYGGIAALGVINVGTDVHFLSSKGWSSVIRTIAGERLGVPKTLSETIPADLAAVDFIQAHRSCAVFWNNRIYVAVPSREQMAGLVGPSDMRSDRDLALLDLRRADPVNDIVLTHNQINQSLAVRQSVLGEEVIGGIVETDGLRESWEGRWTGDHLKPVAFALLNVTGQKHLTFALDSGLVCFFDEGWTDPENTSIADELITRAYFGGKRVATYKAVANWDTFQPRFTVIGRTAGWAEETTILNGEEYSNARFVLDGASGDDFTQQGREDYSINSETDTGSVPYDVHQNITQPLRVRMRDRDPQLVIRNARGSARINNVSITAKPVGIRGRT